jgi:hypothetical protein
MRLLVLAPSLLLILPLACQSGSSGTGVATSGEEVSNPEHAASSQDEDWNRSAEREAAEWARRDSPAAEHEARARAARERLRERFEEEGQAQAERSR